MYQNKIKLISIDESLRSVNYEAKKRKGKTKTVVCANQKQTSTKCDVALYSV